MNAKELYNHSENKVIGFQFEPDSNISNHEWFYQDSIDEGDAIQQDMFVRKYCDSSVCSTMKENRNVCAVKKWRLFAILICRVYLA